MEIQSPVNKPTYEEAYPEIESIVSKRRASWTYLSLMEWSDVKQELLMRAYTEWHRFNPEVGPLQNWLNTLITNRLFNLRRDLLLRTARPCIGGGKTNGKSCVYNTGNDSCSLTPSKTQCAECPVFAKWEREKKAQHHVKNQVSLENHAQEVHSKPDDSADIEGVREWLHTAMLGELSRWEGRVYRLVIIQEIAPSEVAEILTREVARRKRPPSAVEQYSYTAILGYRRMFRGMMRTFLLREGHIGEEHMDPNRNKHRQLSHE